MTSIYKLNYDKDYRLKNKDKLNERIYCNICDCTHTRINKSHHFKSKKHQLLSNSNILKNKVTDLEKKITSINLLTNINMII